MAENVAVLSLEEKASIRHALGYFSITNVGTIALGVLIETQPLFLVDMAMERIPLSAVGRIRQTVAILAGIEARLVDVLDQLVASEVGEVKLNSNVPDLLEREYVRWAKRLADDLGVPSNPYSERMRGGASGPMPGNVRVIRS